MNPSRAPIKGVALTRVPVNYERVTYRPRS